MHNDEQLPRDPGMDGYALTITPLEHGRYQEPNCLEVEDRDGRKWLYVPMSAEKARALEIVHV